jgi:hypothetical protein
MIFPGSGVRDNVPSDKSAACSLFSLPKRSHVPSRETTIHFSAALIGLLENGDPILTTGFVPQELLQGFSGPKAREQIIARFSTFGIRLLGGREHFDTHIVRPEI